MKSLSGQRLSEICRRIKVKYYSSQEVLEIIAEKILKEVFVKK